VSYALLALVGETPENWAAKLNEICAQGKGFKADMKVSGSLDSLNWEREGTG
jgi:hypothetical protein